jgi:hypothetical protein
MFDINCITEILDTTFFILPHIPTISPTPINIPDRPTSCLTLGPICFVKPILGLYTPLKKDSSVPEKRKVRSVSYV